MRDSDKNKYIDLPDEQITRLAQTGDKLALEYLLDKYENWIHKIASKYYFKTNLENEDILAYAKIGFMTGVQEFDSTRSGYFMYFSGIWIRTKILWSIDTYNRLVKLPVNKLKEIRKLKAELIVDAIESQSLEDLQKATGVSEKNLKEYLFNDYSIYNPEDFSTVSGADETVSKQFDEVDLKHDLQKILESFTEIEQYVIIHSFGLFDNIKMDNIDMGEYLEVSSERVRQIKDKCIRRLRHSSFAYILNQYLD